jgi:outer membrane protein assembly factor BamB
MTKRTRLSRWAVFAATLSLLFLTLVNVSRADQTSQWPTAWTKFRLYPNNNAVWGDPNLAVRWTTHTSNFPFTNVTVANGIAYVGAMDNKLIAYDANNGAVLWNAPVGNWIMSDPIVAEGKVFVGSGDRFFHRFTQDVDTGRGEQSQTTLVRGGGPSAFYAFDAQSGKKVWEYETEGENMPTAAYKDGAIYFVSGDRQLRALRASDGALIWQMNLGSYISMSSLNLVGDILYVSGADPNAIYAIDIKNRSMVWAKPTTGIEMGGMDDCSMAYDNGLLFSDSVIRLNADGSYGGHGIYAFDATSGNPVWSFDEGDAPMIQDNKCGVPVAYDGVVYAGSPVTQAMYALDQKTGQLLWKTPAGGAVRGASVIYDGKLYFVNLQGRLFTLDLATGAEIKHKDLSGRVSPQGLVLINGTIYVGTAKGDMYAIPISDLN